MPRRRRRHLDSALPALTFLESPVHVEHSPPSPVYCSDNPATAKVVPVEELPQWNWVSPQFENRGRYTGLRKRRHTDMGQNSTIFTRQRARNTAKSPPNFKTLDFGKKSQHPQSPVQCLNFDENRDTLTETANIARNLSKCELKNDGQTMATNYSPGPVTRSRSSLPSAPNVQQVKNVNSHEMNSSMPESFHDVHTPTESPTMNKKPGYIFQHLFSEFETPKRCRSSDVKVLVYDTPEEEYGIPIRLRGKQYRKRLSKANTSRIHLR